MQTVGPTARMNLLSGDDGHISCENYQRLPQNLFHRKKNRLKSTLDSSNESDTISTVNQYRLYLSFACRLLLRLADGPVGSAGLPVYRLH